MPHPKPRIKNIAILAPESVEAVRALATTAEKLGVSPQTLELVSLRTSQINGCSVCVDIHTRRLRKAGEPDERIFTVAAWRDTPYFTDAERAALALAEAATRINDREDPVTDAVWSEAARYYDEPQLAGLLLAVSATNVWNRVNVATRQPSGAWTGSI